MDHSRLTEPRIVCVGANLESRVALAGLVAERANIVAVVTRPSDNRGSICDYVDLHAYCAASRIVTIDTTNINSLPTLAAIRRAAPDYIYTLGWSQVYGRELLSIPNEYVVGSHPTALPFGRGRAPIPWTILQDVRQSAVSLFRMDGGVDTGNLLIQESFDVSPEAHAAEVYQQATDALTRAYVLLLREHRDSRAIPEIAQSNINVSYRATRTPSDGHIDFGRPAAEIERLVRAVSRPYPGAYTYFAADRRLMRIVIWRASVANTPPYMGTPGQILLHDGERLLVQAGERPLWCWDLSTGEGPIGAREFRVGQRFGLAVEDELVQLRRQVGELQAILERAGIAGPARCVA